ncbi:MAG: 7-cyano-7-deazaguanine synthase [Allosphingosinicella sp.]
MRVLLFSGGIDSTCLAWMERPDRLAFIDYGQIPAKGELRASRAIAGELGLALDVHVTDLRAFGGGSMAGRIGPADAPPEFWPFRNQMLITLAAMIYASQGATELMVGTVRSDRQHSDGRARFLRAMSAVLRSQSGLSVRAPAANEQTHALAKRSGVPVELLGWTFSCHTGEWACGQCRGCQKHAEIKGKLGL